MVKSAISNVGKWAVSFWYIKPKTKIKLYGCLQPNATSAAEAKAIVEQFFSGFGVTYKITSVKLGRCGVIAW